MAKIRNLDKYVKNWLASIKNLNRFNCYIEPEFAESSTDFADDFPIFRAETEYIRIDIYNEIDDEICVEIPLDGISDTTVVMHLNSINKHVFFHADVAICKYILQLCYRFPEQTIKYYNYQYRYAWYLEELGFKPKIS